MINWFKIINSKIYILSTILLLIKLHSEVCECQLLAPSHYWDFTKITNLDGKEQVFDIITKDEKYSIVYGEPRPKQCIGNFSQLSYPLSGPDGTFFKRSTDSLRLPHASQLQFGSLYQLAIWVKIHPRAYVCENKNILTITRYDGEPKPHFLNLQYACESGVFREYFTLNAHSVNTSDPSRYVRIQANSSTNLTIREGWHLISISVDSTSGSKTLLSMRIRSGSGLVDNQDLTFWSLHSEDYYQLNTSDIYLGAYCQSSTSGNGMFVNSSMITIGSMYFWRDAYLTNVQRFERFFFRQNGTETVTPSYNYTKPQCFGRINCSACVISHPFPSSSVAFRQLTCPTERSSDSQVYWANWYFDSPSLNQSSLYYNDTSGNFNHLKQSTINDHHREQIYRIYGQGIMFEVGAFLYTTNTFHLNAQNQFTVEVWARQVVDEDAGRIFDSNSVLFSIFTIFDLQNNMTLMSWNVTQASSKFCYQNCTQFSMSNTSFGLSQSWSMYTLTFGKYENKVPSSKFDFSRNSFVIRHSMNSYSYTDQRSEYFSSNQTQPIETTATSQLRIGPHQSTILLRSFKIYKYIKLLNGDDGSTSSFQSQQCKNSSSQPNDQCNICPRDEWAQFVVNDATKQMNGVCLTNCKPNTYGPFCLPCHPGCGHCTGPALEDCVFCNKNTALSNITYNKIFGNCSCPDGEFLNTTSRQCQQCHQNCLTCFGPRKDQCMTCRNNSTFFPNTTCLSNCSDELLANKTNTFFPLNQTFQGEERKTCQKCHSNCKGCFGASLNECSECSNGYFKQDSNSSTCLQTCPDGKYPNTTFKDCQLCDSQCSTCFGPNSTHCLTCSNPFLVSQNGICQPKCNNGFYASEERICIKCHSECATCSGPGQDQCLSCSNNLFLEWAGTKCSSKCGDQLYKDKQSNRCLQCHFSCKSCTGGNQDQCSECKDGLYKRNGFCSSSCGEGEYLFKGECVKCDKKCQTCFGPTAEECTSCSFDFSTMTQYYQHENSCVSICPDGFYADQSSHQCLRCNSKCSKCISENICTECIEGPYTLNKGECSFFTCLDSQYRSLKPSPACHSCHESCKTCQGSSKFDCLSCKTDYMLVEQQCLTCDQQPGMMNSKDLSKQGCEEICGDGFNFGNYQCDDGNLINGDGCSSTCQIENGFNCTTGSKFSPSTCMDNRNPVPSITIITPENSLYLSFDEEVYLSANLDSSSLEISVQGPESNYKFDWMLEEIYQTSEAVQMIAIKLSFYTSLKGYGTEKITLRFLDYGVYRDLTGNGILITPLVGNLNKYDYIDPTVSASLNAASDTSIIGTYGILAANILIQQLFGGSIDAMWTMVNTLQLLALFPLCSVHYPPLVTMVLQRMLTTHGESTAIPNLFYSLLFDQPDSKGRIEKPLNKIFSDYGWKVSNFLYLSGRKILIWLVLIGIYPFVRMMKNRYADKHKVCGKWKEIEQKFRYSLLLRGVSISYVSMYLAFLLGIFRMDLTTKENAISAFTAVAFGIILTYLPILIMNILQNNYERIDSPKFILQYSPIVKEMNLNHPLKYMYFPVFLIRRAIFAIQLVIFTDRPEWQLGLMALTAFMMMTYIIVIQPHKDFKILILAALSEGFLGILHCYSAIFLRDDLNQEDQNTYGLIFLAIIGVYMIANWVTIIKISVKQLQSKWKERKSAKENAEIQKQEDIVYQNWKKMRRKKQKENFRKKIARREQLQLLQTQNINVSPLNSLQEWQLNPYQQGFKAPSITQSPNYKSFQEENSSQVNLQFQRYRPSMQLVIPKFEKNVLIPSPCYKSQISVSDLNGTDQKLFFYQDHQNESESQIPSFYDNNRLNLISQNQQSPYTATHIKYQSSFQTNKALSQIFESQTYPIRQFSGLSGVRLKSDNSNSGGSGSEPPTNRVLVNDNQEEIKAFERLETRHNFSNSRNWIAQPRIMNLTSINQAQANTQLNIPAQQNLNRRKLIPSQFYYQNMQEQSPSS